MLAKATHEIHGSLEGIEDDKPKMKTTKRNNTIKRRGNRRPGTDVRLCFYHVPLGIEDFRFDLSVIIAVTSRI